MRYVLLKYISEQSEKNYETWNIAFSFLNGFI